MFGCLKLTSKHVFNISKHSKSNIQTFRPNQPILQADGFRDARGAVPSTCSTSPCTYTFSIGDGPMAAPCMKPVHGFENDSNDAQVNVAVDGDNYDDKDDKRP